MLNVGKRINMCGDYSVGFVDFSKQKYDNICKVIHSNYSKFDIGRRKFIMNNLMKILNLLNTCKVIRVIDKWLSIFMIQDDVRRNV